MNERSRVSWIGCLGALSLLAADVAAQECGALFPGRAYPLPDGALTNAVAIGDMNGDGRNDLVVARWTFGSNGSQVEVLLGVPPTDHVLATTVNLPEAYDLALGDLDNDGNLDAVVTGPFSQTVTPLLGDGLGGLTPLATSPTGAAFTQSITTGDFDHDGDDDVAIVTKTPATLRTFASTSGTLAVQTTINLLSPSLEAHPADFDLDGSLDLAVLASGGGVAFYQGTGTGAFSFVNGALTAGPARSLAVGNFDADPRPELVVASPSEVTYLDGAPGFVFTPSSIPVGFGTPEWIAALHADQDGHLDFAFLNQNAGWTRIMHGDGSGGFQLGELSIGDQMPLALVAGDLDADGLDDLASVSGGPLVTTLRQDATAGIVGSRTPDFFSGGGLLSDFAMVDLDGDAHHDVLALHWISNPRLYPHFGDGKGDFAIGLKTTLSGAPFRLAVGDFDGDGVTDAAVAHQSLVGQTPLDLRLGAGNGTFPVILDSSAPAGDWPADVTIADLNLDGLSDVITTTRFDAAPGNVTVRESAGGGAFVGGATYTAGSRPESTAVGDIDLDGDIDIVTCSSLDATLTIALGDGAGGFVPTTLPSGPLPLQVALPDLDVDGFADLVTTHTAIMETRRGLGGGAFAAATVYSTPDGVRQLTVADLDQDGDDDLVGAGSYTVQVFPSRGDGLLDDGGAYRAMNGSAGVAVADIVEDGDFDVLAIDENTQGALLLPRNPTETPWSSLGGATPGSNGVPSLVGSGSLLTGCPMSLTLTDAASASTALLLVSTSSSPSAFLGGTLHAFPPQVTLSLTTSPTGELPIALAAWPAGLSGAELFLQYVIADPGAAFGPAALSNGLRAQVP